MGRSKTLERKEDSIGESRGQYVFTEGLELVLGEVLPLLGLGDPQIQIHQAQTAEIPSAKPPIRVPPLRIRVSWIAVVD
jgi:hypothetical protein